MKILIEANDSNDYQLLADLGWDDVELLISGILRVGCRVMIAQHSQSGSTLELQTILRFLQSRLLGPFPFQPVEGPSGALFMIVKTTD